MPQAPTVNRTVPIITPVSVVRNGANHWVALITEFCATHPTDNDPMVNNTEPRRPTAIAGQTNPLVLARPCSKVVINSFPSDSLISMTLGINVSPQVGRLSIDTSSRRNILDNPNTPEPFEPASEAAKDQDRNMVWLDAEMTGLYPGVDALVEVAIIITDADLNVLDDGIDIIIKPPAAAVEQ